MSRLLRVQIVQADEGWILQKCANEIAERFDYVNISSKPDPNANLNYYLNYSAWKGKVTPTEAAFFTHIEELKPKTAARFFEVSRWMNGCVCMAQRYVDKIQETGHPNVVQIRPGVDNVLYAPRLRVGVVGRTYHTGRKGEDLVKAVLDLEGVDWVFTGGGWPGEGGFVPEPELQTYIVHSITCWFLLITKVVLCQLLRVSHVELL